MTKKQNVTPIGTRMTAERIFKVEGFSEECGEVTKYYRTSGGKEEVSVRLMSVPLNSGGFERYTITEIESLPERYHLKCPHCGEKYEDERDVLTL